MLSRNLFSISANCSKYTSPAIPKFFRRRQLGAFYSSNSWHELQKRSEAKSTNGRVFSTSGSSPSSSPSHSPIRVSHVLGALLVFGIGATSWGLYEFYMTLTIWPKEVRGDLRAGLRAKERGDLKLSQRHLTRAWETIQTLPSESLFPDPYLKFSGVAVVLAEVLEADQQLDEAFSVLRAALTTFIQSRKAPSTTPSSSNINAPSSASDLSTPSSSSSTPPAPSSHRISLSMLLDSGRPSTAGSQINTRTRMRAVALALKLGDLAETLSRTEEEEYWLGFAVAEVLRIVRDEYGLLHDTRRGFVQSGAGPAKANVQKNSAENSGKLFTNSESDNGQKVGHETSVGDILSANSEDGELGLPAWVSLTKSELAAPMERLGAFYARQGKAGNAILLYRVASSLLVHPKSKASVPGQRTSTAAPGVMELCQALQIENAHMALLMNLRHARPEDAAIQRDLPRVLSRAVQIYDEAVRIHGRGQTRDDGVGNDAEIALCDETYPAVLYNAGVYYEEEGQLEQALRSYSLSYMALRTHGPRELVQEALESARRLQRIVDKNTKHAAQAPDQTRPSTPASDSLDQ